MFSGLPTPSGQSVRKRGFFPHPRPLQRKAPVQMLSSAGWLEPLQRASFTLWERDQGFHGSRGEVWISQLLGYLGARSLISLSLSFACRKVGIIIPFLKALQRPSKKLIFTVLENTKHCEKFFSVHYYFSSFSPLDVVDTVAIFQMGKWRHKVLKCLPKTAVIKWQS